MKLSDNGVGVSRSKTCALDMVIYRLSFEHHVGPPAASGPSSQTIVVGILPCCRFFQSN